ncbi:L-prolyl-[peptidyl carrier protein] dehydrogenase [Streptomyces sp. DI166]|uniref:acyl-CoA dehydrogenase family protein n=1 Tax=Streptomyces sp. DI166 TaxID=1839783 RepID=UPI0007F37F3C|nr:acyl-CoA dehydrogenase family protein [Streptomyces sp. DI166]SBT90042.1 L-prolyl-[peptidyl carrier protein] dehydrogenase [Streptomyces sp. DI166]
MDFAWTEEQRQAYDDTLAAVREAFPPSDGTAEYYHRGDWKTLGQLGLLGLSVPTEYGGGGLGAVDTARQVEALGRGCDRTGLVFGASAHLFACSMPIVDFGSPAVKSRVLPGMCTGELIAGNAMTEDEAGSDVSKLATVAERTDGGWILNGEKSFVTNGPAADVFTTYATTDPKAGYLGVTGFVVERGAPGLTIGEPFDKMGMSQVPAGRLTFENCFVPDDQVLGEEGQGGFIFQHSMGWERCCLFAGFLGLSDRLLDRAVEQARTRKQSGRRISRFQAVSHRIADMKLRTESARLLLYRAAWEMDRGGPATLWIALSKLAVSEGVITTALDTVRLFGGRGYLRSEGIEAALRDAVPSVIFSGTSDIQRDIISRELGL